MHTEHWILHNLKTIFQILLHPIFKERNVIFRKNYVVTQFLWLTVQNYDHLAAEVGYDSSDILEGYALLSLNKKMCKNYKRKN